MILRTSSVLAKFTPIIFVSFSYKTFLIGVSFTFLVFLFPLCSEFKDSGEGSVADFKGKRIIGVLAGPAETTNPNDKRAMDAMLNNNGFLKWFENKDYGDDPCSPLQASGASWDAPTPSEPSSSGPAAPAAVPRRVGRVLRPALMRRSGMLVHPRLASKSAGFRIIK